MSVLRPDAATTLCLNIRCQMHDKCIRYVKGANLTVAEFNDYQWIESCDHFKLFVNKMFFNTQ
ncbi:MAG: hypothetical protein IJK99_09530 [Bacteroidales bacterium]|nr:hypothetical protein [Bacteroidales bacterium]